MALKIGEVAGRGGVNLQTIRYYEREGLLPKPPRLQSGYRMFPESTVRRVRFIKRAQELGFSLAEIKLFLSGLRDNAPVGPSWKKLATKKLAEVEDSIARSLRLKTLLQNLLHCRCASLKQCVTALGLSENLRFVANRPH